MSRGRLRALSMRTPLRIKLVAAVLVLVTLALLGSGAVAAAALRRSLVARVDSQIGAVLDSPGGGSGAPHFDDEHRGGRQLPSTYYWQRAEADGTFAQEGNQPLEPGQAPPRLPHLDLQAVTDRAGKPFTVPATSGDGTWRVVTAPLDDGSVMVAQSLAGVQTTVAQLVRLQLVIGAVALALLAALGYLLVRRSLRPLVDVERTAAAIAAGNLSRRVPELDPRTEVGRLSAAMNGMLAQIESAFRQQERSEAAARASASAAQCSEAAARTSEASARASEDRMRRFIADASHELRTPLTSIRGFAELSRQRGSATDPEDARFMRRIEDEAARMGLLVEDLLLLARLDQQRPLERRDVDLLALAADAVHDARAVAPDRRVELAVADGPDVPVVVGDEARLRQVLGNLVANALTHTPAGTPVSVRLGTRLAPAGAGAGRWAALEVADEGPGLTPAEADRVFERFYRADTSRTRASGGSGLGLSIVAALTAAHGGRVEVDTAPGRGVTFRVLLPLAPTDS